MEVLILLVVGCASPLADDTPYVSTPRVLVVRAEPAEVEAGAEVRLLALYADETGALADGPVDWAFCGARKPLAELGPVSSTCLEPASETLAPIGTGLDVTGVLPEDACSLFGPNPPPAGADGQAGRPVDPDVTGGYYQPTLGFVDDDVTLAAVRVRCGLAGASQEDYVAWNLAYYANENPEVASVRMAGGEVDPGDDPVAVGPGQSVDLSVAWSECPEAPAPCAGAEAYVRYDAATGELVTVREAISVAWYATAGTFAAARGGRTGDDPETTSDNVWTAPDDAGEAWVGVVIRDERGGVGFTGWRVAVGQ